ncbi:MAG: ribonuclease HI [Candidatus Parcubacteria bacterium]|uniref:ribonuclease H family protein n=1 Tax=Phormidesmis priestleyi TaxID=268141 RepID=UPI00083A904B|nr:ribonuclease H [Phormidesmis priestleyi]MBC7825070.1 ribonuclease HI [Leptolyngbyaceae cyanobacterium LF-bin-113]
MNNSLVRAIYTDGSGNVGVCGYAAVVRFADSTTIELGGYEPDSTNLRAELLGVITALEYLRANPQPLKAPIFSDSKYAIDGLNEQWVSIWQQRSWLTIKGKPVVNRDLWERLEALRSVPATFHHLRGHTDAAGKKGRDALAQNRACFGEDTPLHNAGNQAADRAADGFRLNWATLKPDEQTDITAKAVSYVKNSLPD